ncbi:aminotransferase class I and II [Penicillium lagena]|uniref:aminotransferase class I and II n=1 Tax=Penicillium lagena TaxID=94218 RepID=UPI0025426166|nr:aminotransferase class I and II [Penicillium lagena]KAJ5601193.1 aminotransferase class I and II [Penicillium lagena]
MPIEIESPEESGYHNIRCNLIESSIADRSIGSLNLVIPDLKLQYTEHRGSQRLRELVVGDEPKLTAKDVMITTGTAGALFIVATTILAPKDHMLIVRPNYAINLATPRAIGCDITYFDLTFGNEFRIDFEALRDAIHPNTRLISLTNPHNPSGQTMSRDDLDRLVGLALEKRCYLLVDEIYREIIFGKKLPISASLGDHVISVGSLSKCFGVPGTRTGWLINRNVELMESFLAAKEQINICGSVVDEWIAEQILSRFSILLPLTILDMKARRDIVACWVAQEECLEWIRPQGGMVCIIHMIKEPVGGPAAFYKRLTEQYGVYVAPGRWFELEDVYFRVGFGWPTIDELRYGLEKISVALRG